MKNTLLGVIAVCLFMITLKLYIPEANAEAVLNLYPDDNHTTFTEADGKYLNDQDFINSVVKIIKIINKETSNIRVKEHQELETRLTQASYSSGYLGTILTLVDKKCVVDTRISFASGADAELKCYPLTEEDKKLLDESIKETNNKIIEKGN